MSYIPYGKQLIDEEDIAAVVEVLRSDWLTTGPKVTEFEEALAAKVGAKHAVVFNSGTAALHGAYFAAGIGPGCEVITSPITFAATSNAALYLGAKPVFVDVEPDTANLNPQLVARAINSGTRIIAPVDFTGNPCNLEEIKEIAFKNKLLVVEDAAHALGAFYKGKPIGSLADMTAFSFHPVKPITTGEGGAVTTDNEDSYKRLLCFRNHGIIRDPQYLSEFPGAWYYEMQELGYNFRLTDIQCALGLSQLKKLEAFTFRRQEIASMYIKLLGDLEELKLPTISSDAVPAWHLFVIRINSDMICRDRLFERLQARGIGVQVHYLPVYRHPYYSKLGYGEGLCPVAEDFYRSAISLPIFPALTDDNVMKVAEVIKEEIKFLRG